MHNGRWEKSAKGCSEVRGKKLGIIGYGNIGMQLSTMAEALGMEVYFFDVFDKMALGGAKKCGTLNELLGKCDIISLHVSANPENKKIYSKLFTEYMDIYKRNKKMFKHLNL